MTLHRILVHMIAETHRHAGHADIVRELIDGAAGLRADNDNLPPGDEAWWEAYRERRWRRRRPGEAAGALKREVSRRRARGEPGVVVGDGAAVGEQLAVVVEQDDAVAQQSPALLGVAADDGGEVTRLAGGVGAGFGWWHMAVPSVRPRHGAGSDVRVRPITVRQVCARPEASAVTRLTRSPRRVVHFLPSGPRGRQSLRSRTRRTEWSAAFCSTSRARDRVGAML